MDATKAMALITQKARELEEENKKLKEDNKKLKEQILGIHNDEMDINGLFDDINKLKEKKDKFKDFYVKKSKELKELNKKIDDFKLMLKNSSEEDDSEYDTWDIIEATLKIDACGGNIVEGEWESRIKMHKTLQNWLDTNLSVKMVYEGDYEEFIFGFEEYEGLQDKFEAYIIGEYNDIEGTKPYHLRDWVQTNDKDEAICVDDVGVLAELIETWFDRQGVPHSVMEEYEKRNNDSRNQETESDSSDDE